MPKVRAVITTRWQGRGNVPFEIDSVQSHMVDSALDTDTDSWTITIGDVNNLLVDMLKRDNEVKVNIFALGNSKTAALNMGFADEITYDHNNLWTINGRDMTAVAVDSQHPPQIWSGIRPEVLVARETRQLKIADKLRLDKAKPFKKYATDGSESFWQVWYRFYRKRQKWMYAEGDGEIVATSLFYGQSPVYFFGSPRGMIFNHNANWIPVESMEWRADKTQRVGEVFVFGHRGDIGFVASATDPATKTWVKKPTRIFTSADVHNQAEARVEALEEIFESKVGSVEIRLTVFDPGHTIRQNNMAMVNIPHVGLTGEFFIVGVQTVGNIDEGQYQIVRLREKTYALSRRVVNDPVMNAGPGEKTTGNVAENLSGSFRWKESFVKAATTYHGPWPFSLFLAVLLSIAQKESSFNNVRENGNIEYPGTYDGVKNGDFPSVFQATAYQKFVNNFSNEISKGRVANEWGVGPMQLTTVGYKLLADRLFNPDRVDDELLGGRWDADSNINAAAAALNSKLGGGFAITPDGQLRKVKISGLSLRPTAENIWQGVADYNGSRITDQYTKDVKAIYTNTFKTQVDTALQTSRSQANEIEVPQQTSFVLRNMVLDHKAISFTKQSQIDDIRLGRIEDDVLKFLLAFTEAGFPVTITALRSDHEHLGKCSAHAWGLAVDLGNYGKDNPRSLYAMQWIGQYQIQLGFSQLIGPIPSLVLPLGFYNADTLKDHLTHIHVGWPCQMCAKYRALGQC